MKLDMDLKTLVMIVTTACALAGFYYTTQARLDIIEAKIEKIETNQHWVTKQIRSLKIGKQK